MITNFRDQSTTPDLKRSGHWQLFQVSSGNFLQQTINRSLWVQLCRNRPVVIAAQMHKKLSQVKGKQPSPGEEYK